MTEEKKILIANSFPDNFATGNISVDLSLDEFELLKKGIFAEDMDSKWHIFILSKDLYFARSWTNTCIYKIPLEKSFDHIHLSKFYVTRNSELYRSTDIEFDRKLLLQVFQAYLKREDLYVDPELNLPLIKRTIEILDPNNECKKSIGSNNVGITRQIHSSLTSDEQKKYCDIVGWTELKAKISNKNDDEPLISLHLQNRQTLSAVTYYFDKDASELLGQIIIKAK